MSSSSETDSVPGSPVNNVVPQETSVDDAAAAQDRFYSEVTEKVSENEQGVTHGNLRDIMDAVREEDVALRLEKIEKALYSLEDRRFGSLSYRIRQAEQKLLNLDLQYAYMRDGIERMACDLEKALGQSNTVYFFMKRCQEIGEIYAPQAKRRNASSYFGPPPGSLSRTSRNFGSPAHESPPRSGPRPALY
jgi:hypothetical protein